MVNYGPSGACHACREKRKKCDQSRPSCLRCGRARRICPGYESTKERQFINYIGKEDFQVLHQATSELWHQVAVSDGLGTLDWPDIERNARLAFFDDYCILSSNRNLSRGYLHGLRAMVSKAGPNSELVQALTIIALANLGRKLGNFMYKHRAESLYSSLLRSFRLSISNQAVFTTVESLITATLLGLYEIITSTGTSFRAHAAHARGISAILVSKFSPFDLLCDGALFRVANPTPLEDLEMEIFEPPLPLPHSSAVVNEVSQKFSVLCTPLFNQPSSVIDFFYARTISLVRKGKDLLDNEAEVTIDQLCQLKSEAEQLREAYDTWPSTVPPEWIPKSVGLITPKGEDTVPQVGYWPTTILSYYDLYVASLWNNYRKAALLMLSIILKCHYRLNGYLSDQIFEDSVQKDISKQSQGIVSSIPYLLTADLPTFVDNAARASPPIVPGQPIGGLLSMHTLFVLATSPIVEEDLRIYARNCLAWIGAHMGIGQAAVLSKYTKLTQFPYATEARVIIWTGMLI